MRMELQLSIFLLLIQVSLGVWQRVTVMKGQPLSLNCPIRNADKTHVEWRNPQGLVMFFSQIKVAKDKRYSINKLTQSEFSINISNIKFKDGGIYTCSLYSHPLVEMKVEVTVIGHPRMSVERHEEETVIKCSAESSSSPSLLSWKLDHGSEFSFYQTNYLQKHKRVSESLLHVRAGRSRVTVTCVVRYIPPHSLSLTNFVKVGRDSKTSLPTTSWPTAPAQGSTGVPGRTTSWFRQGRTSVSSTRGGLTRPLSESSTVSSELPLSSSEPQTLTTTRSPLDSDHRSSTGWTSGNDTSNTTKRNETGSFNSNGQIGPHRKPALLVVLVTCLIVSLLVVVIFFAIKLRRAHIAWRRENEESDPSEESSKSKSSQEEKTSQGQRGLFTTVFAKYVIEEPTRRTSELNTDTQTAPVCVNKEHTPQPAPAQLSSKTDIKETSL